MGAWDSFLDALFSVRSIQQFLVLYKKNGELDGGETRGVIASMSRMAACSLASVLRNCSSLQRSFARQLVGTRIP